MSVPGVSLDFLKTFRDRLAQFENSDQFSVHDVISAVVKPETRKAKEVYCNLSASVNDDQGRPHTKPQADVAVLLPESLPCLASLDLLVSWLGRQSDHVYVHVEPFCCNLHTDGRRWASAATLEDALDAAVFSTVNKVLVVTSPWPEPIVLSDTYLLYCLYRAASLDLPVTFVLSWGDERALRGDLLGDFDAVVSALGSVTFQRTRMQDDNHQALVMSLVKNRGIREVNDRIRALLFDWLMELSLGVEKVLLEIIFGDLRAVPASQSQREVAYHDVFGSLAEPEPLALTGPVQETGDAQVEKEEEAPDKGDGEKVVNEEGNVAEATAESEIESAPQQTPDEAAEEAPVKDEATDEAEAERPNENSVTSGEPQAEVPEPPSTPQEAVAATESQDTPPETSEVAPATVEQPQVSDNPENQPQAATADPESDVDPGAPPPQALRRKKSVKFNAMIEVKEVITNRRRTPSEVDADETSYVKIPMETLHPNDEGGVLIKDDAHLSGPDANPDTVSTETTGSSDDSVFEGDDAQKRGEIVEQNVETGEISTDEAPQVSDGHEAVTDVSDEIKLQSTEGSSGDIPTQAGHEESAPEISDVIPSSEDSHSVSEMKQTSGDEQPAGDEIMSHDEIPVVEHAEGEAPPSDVQLTVEISEGQPSEPTEAECPVVHAPESSDGCIAAAGTAPILESAQIVGEDTADPEAETNSGAENADETSEAPALEITEPVTTDNTDAATCESGESAPPPPREDTDCGESREESWENELRIDVGCEETSAEAAFLTETRGSAVGVDVADTYSPRSANLFQLQSLQTNIAEMLSGWQEKSAQAAHFFLKALENQTALADSHGCPPPAQCSMMAATQRRVAELCEREHQLQHSLRFYTRCLDTLKGIQGLDTREEMYRVLSKIANIHVGLDNLKLAVSYYRDALRMAEGMQGLVSAQELTRLNLEVADIYFESGEHEPALAHYRRALHLLGDSREEPAGRAHDRIARIQFQRGAYAEATHHFTAALDILADSRGTQLDEVYDMLGCSQFYSGEIEAAIQSFQNVLNRMNEAKARVKRPSVGPSSVTTNTEQEGVGLVYCKLGRCHYSLGNWEQAVAFFSRDLELQGALHGAGSAQVGRACANLGEVYCRMGEGARCLQLWKQAYGILHEALGHRHAETLLVKRYLERLVWM